MTVGELRREAHDGETFIVLTAQGRRLLCRWVNVRAGLFNIEEVGGRPVKGKCLCDVKGAPDSPVVKING